MNIGVTPAPDAPFPDLPGAPENGFREILSFWMRTEADGSEHIASQVRPIFLDAPQKWIPTIITFVQAIAACYADGQKTTQQEVERLAALLLIGSLKQMDDADKGSVKAAMESQPTKITHPVMRPLEDMNDDLLHPGSLGLPDEAAENDDAQQVLSVWVAPPEDCDDCGETHTAQMYVMAHTAMMEAADFGGLLAQLAAGHSAEVGGTVNDQMIVLANVQKGFHDALTVGLPRA